MKHLTLKITIVAFLCAAGFYSCKKTTTTTVVKNKAYVAPVLAEITSIVLKKMPPKVNQIGLPSFDDWDFEQLEEQPGADIIIDILDSIPYYAVYGGGFLKENLVQDSLPSVFGQKNNNFKIRNLSDKFHVVMLDSDKNSEAEQMALLPFRLSDFQLTKPSEIILTNTTTDYNTMIVLKVTWR